MSGKNEFSELADHELVQAFSQTGDPWVFEILKSRRKTQDSKQGIETGKHI